MTSNVPSVRRLRIFSFDPALAARYDLAGISGVTIEIPWDKTLQPGPIDEYIQVVDIDPASKAAYSPVDLNARDVLATDGLQPSESDPRFHQQMCYAVARKTIEHFERALGRKALWSAHATTDARGTPSENFVARLRIYPHALRQRNAYYSPSKKALLFGYFINNKYDGKNTPGTTVFTALSHDIIAHETTHALLDGVHPRFSEPVGPDVLAFHEAFADIVALFQHFSYPGVLRDQIARTRGDLVRESLLGQLAQQFALASGRGDALRSYLGKVVDGVWQPVKPDPTLIATKGEPHERGAILVAAVFGAFTTVYQARTRDLFRIATEGTGVLRDGDIHPDLVSRLAEEAQRAAERTLQMCIRAIDYCPPVGIEFGSYLRAVITADYDVNPVDRQYWRLAFIESFREWGIYPRATRSMAEDSLLWPTLSDLAEDRVKLENREAISRGDISREQAGRSFESVVQDTAQKSRSVVTQFFKQAAPFKATDDVYSLKSARIVTSGAHQRSEAGKVFRPTPLSWSRHDAWVDADRQAANLHAWLMSEETTSLLDVLGLVVGVSGLPKTIAAKDGRRANVEVHSVRTAVKQSALGWSEPHMVAVIMQWRAGYFDENMQKEMDGTKGAWQLKNWDFKYRAGCTVLFDPEGMDVRRVIRTPGRVDNEEGLRQMRNYLRRDLARSDAFYGVSSRLAANSEPFAFLHAHAED